MTRLTLAVLLAALATAGCSTAIILTPEGRGVERVTDATRPPGCNLLGDVAIGVPPDAARPRTEDELFILMRNKTGEQGGTHVTVDMTERREAETPDGEDHWIGRARAYNCAASPAGSTPLEETSGGEDGEGEGEGDGRGDGEGDGEEAPEPAEDLPI